MRKLVALVLLLALTGCSAQEPAPSVTPVDIKFCALSDSNGFNDDGLNRSVYAALQQLKVQTGASVMAIEVSEQLAPAAGIQKLIEANCNAVITSGDALVGPALSAAKGNKSVDFYAVSDSINNSDYQANFKRLSFNIYQAAFAAGFLAAAESTSKAEIAVLNLRRDFASRKVVKAFTAGVARFNTQNRSQVKIKNLAKLSDLNQEVVFALAGSAKEFGDYEFSESVKLIGFGRDWYLDPRNESLQPNLLTSVIRFDVIGKVVSAVTEAKISASYDLTNEGVGLAAEHELNWPARFASELDLIIKDLLDGKVKVS
jgi:basic membrane lipoprotein Med (substrate-binding protein (PBP1-ABC) superfamily)